MRECRFCSSELSQTFCDLGMSPLSNSYLTEMQCKQMEPFYPLHVWVCEQCYLVQLEEFETPKKIFSDYAYFSSYSKSWLEHARIYVDAIMERYNYGRDSLVIEIASNDGYLLKNFIEKGIPVLGIEPAENVAQVAERAGVKSLVSFFDTVIAGELARKKKADLLIANNVLAHVPNINDFVSGMKIILSDEGVITIEFPHLLQLIRFNQFDTIYHEHFSYLSLLTVDKIFNKHNLRIFDVEMLSTHGGSLRVYASHKEDESKPIKPIVHEIKGIERQDGLDSVEVYIAFQGKVKRLKREILSFLISEKNKEKSIVGYGAPAKGNTLLNYCGIRTDFIDYTVDVSPYKQNLFLPGTHIPICAPESICLTKPDYLFILPWNIKDEIMEQMSYVRDWGCMFVTPIPSLQVL